MLTTENEVLIKSSSNNGIILTSHKVKQQLGRDVVIIPLNKISTIKVYYKDAPAFLIVGIIFLLVGAYYLFRQEELHSVGFLLGGAALTFWYFLSRKHIVSIIADNAQSINFEIRKASDTKVSEFIGELEQAIHAYLRQLA